MSSPSPDPADQLIDVSAIVIAWDPTKISEDDYIALVVAIGELVRAEGCSGIERLRANGHGVHVGDGAVV
jgi:hypothetical protein